MIKEYTCNAKVKACPMKRGEYNSYRGWEIPADENADDDGFLCLREDNSETWVPRELFLGTHVEGAVNPQPSTSDAAVQRRQEMALALVSNGHLLPDMEGLNTLTIIDMWVEAGLMPRGQE
jgi:hypothetical protein